MRVKESEMRYSLSVGELKEGYRLNKDMRTKQPSAWEMVLLAWIQRSPRESWQKSEEAGHDSSMGRRDEADINYWRQVFKNGSSRGVTSLSLSVSGPVQDRDWEGGWGFWTGHLQGQHWAEACGSSRGWRLRGGWSAGEGRSWVQWSHPSSCSLCPVGKVSEWKTPPPLTGGREIDPVITFLE